MKIETLRQLVELLREIDTYTDNIKNKMIEIIDNMNLCGKNYLEVLRIISKEKIEE